MSGRLTRREMVQLSAGALAAVSLPSFSTFADSSATDLKWGANLPATLDPHTVLDAPSTFPRANIYDTLFRYTGSGFDLTPHLVESYEVGDGNLRYDFTIRKGIRFHDGSLMTAADAVYSIKRILTLRKGPAALFAGILVPEKVTALDDTKFRLVLESPYAPLVDVLIHVAVINSALVQANAANDMGQAWIASRDAGSGAYKIVERSFIPLQQLDLTRNADYFMPFASKKPIERIFCRPTTDDATRIMALEKGDIDTTNANLSPVYVDRLKSRQDVKVFMSDPMRVLVTHMCTQREPFNNLNFRKAIAYAFPYELYLKKIMKGQMQRNGIPLPVTMWGAAKGVKGYEYDLAKAKEYLGKAVAEGVKIERPLEYLTVHGSEVMTTVGQLLQSELRKLGLKLNISSAVWATILQRAQRLDTSPDIVSLWSSSYILDPHTFFAPYATTAHGSIQGASWFDNADINTRIVKASQLSDKKERQAMYEALSADILDQTPSLFYYAGVFARGVRARVKGFDRNALMDDVPVSRLWLES